MNYYNKKHRKFDCILLQLHLQKQICRDFSPWVLLCTFYCASSQKAVRSLVRFDWNCVSFWDHFCSQNFLEIHMLKIFINWYFICCLFGFLNSNNELSRNKKTKTLSTNLCELFYTLMSPNLCNSISARKLPHARDSLMKRWQSIFLKTYDS